MSVWQTRFLMVPQIQGLYVCHANGYKLECAGHWVHVPNAYLCSDGAVTESGKTYGVVYPDGTGEWCLGDRESICCPIGTGGDTVQIGGAPRTIRAAQPSRLQHMTESDAKAEGVAAVLERTKRTGREVWSHLLGFRAKWDAAAPDGAKWADNPWVWVVMHEPAARGAQCSLAALAGGGQ